MDEKDQRFELEDPSTKYILHPPHDEQEGLGVRGRLCTMYA